MSKRKLHRRRWRGVIGGRRDDVANQRAKQGAGLVWCIRVIKCAMFVQSMSE